MHAAVAPPELRTSGRGHWGNWIYTAAEYEDFRLTFEYSLAQWAETAVVLRAPQTDRPWSAGLSIVLAHDFHKHLSANVTGAELSRRPPAKLLPVTYAVWHKAEILIRAGTYRVTIDGELLQQRPLPATLLPRGVIGFADMGHAYALRNLAMEDLGRPTPWTNLITGQSLKGWEKRGDSGDWALDAAGTLRGTNGHSILYAPGEFADFEFSAVVRSHNRTNSGVFLRGLPAGPRRGFEVQIYSPVDAVYPTGSVYGLARSNISADLEERWFLLQIRVQGPKCEVWLDGEPAIATDRLEGDRLLPGRIGLQIHLEDTSVEFRDLRIRLL